MDISKLAEMGIQVTTHPEEGRGCGERKEAEPYACCGTSPWGKLIEEFVVDPARPWPTGWQRGVMPVQRKSGIYDVAIFIGKAYWPSPWDKVEEVRHYGESRRFPKNFPFHLLMPGKSRMHLIHSLAIPNFLYQCDRVKPLAGCKVFRGEYDLWDDPKVIPGWHPRVEANERPCTFALRDLAYLVNPSHIGIDDDIGSASLGISQSEPNGIFEVHNPSVTYKGRYPNPYTYPEEAEKKGWECGLFLSLPLTHMEWKGHADLETEKRIKEAGFENVVLDW